MGFLARRCEDEQPEYIHIYEDCELSGNIDKNSSAKSILKYEMVI